MKPKRSSPRAASSPRVSNHRRAALGSLWFCGICFAASLPKAAADYAFNNRPLSPEQVTEHRALVALADAAQDACDAFYAANCKVAGGALNC